MTIEYKTEVICPKCSKVSFRIEGFGTASKSGPKPGEIAICSDCGFVAMFDEHYCLVAAKKGWTDQFNEKELELISDLVKAGEDYARSKRSSTSRI